MLFKIALLYLFLYFQSVRLQDSSNCESKETCSECLQELGCIWCIEPNNKTNGETVTFCIHKNDSSSNWCSQSKTVDLQSFHSVIQNESLSNIAGAIVQIRPQKIKLSLRKGEEFVLPFQYAQAENYPVDLYYLMDLSASMDSHREKLGILGSKLAATMRNITNNFRLGFGSFVDKVELPFVSTVPEKLKSPCSFKKNGKTTPCVAPYSFKNHMSLTHNDATFSNEVSKAQVSGNLDTPEGGFDAIMQAIVCKQQIGWREKARHLLVFSTDADFHIAGDGKLAGVVEPNDAKCHMQDNTYLDYLVYDYPSVSQINYIAKENNINIIFAIAPRSTGVTKLYKALSERIENSNTGTLDDKSENVVNLVLDNYNKIVDSVTITSNATNDVEIRIVSNCTKPKENGCTNIHVGEVVNFNAIIKPLECSSNGTNTKIISIKPEGLDESIIIELEVLCNCPCEYSRDENFKADAFECTSQGNLECGVCNCKLGRYGRNCECDSLTSKTDDVENCRKEADGEICSGLGVCKCGKCECNKRTNPNEKIYGKYCQCDNYSCKRDERALCSNNGFCDCGQCKCYAGWTGDTCQCPASNHTCIAPGGDGSVCNGRGSCDCGKCSCFADKYKYSGKYCEECPSCPAQRCKEFQDCVECQAYKTGKYNENECKIKCIDFTTEIIPKVHAEESTEFLKICRIPVAQDCTYVFEYLYNDDKELIVRAEEKKICNPPPNILLWILGVIGTILVAGLLSLLIWKVVTTLHDRREYAKFENERKNAKWNRNDNPLYKGAVSTFSNPVYNRGSKRYSFKSKRTNSE